MSYYLMLAIIKNNSLDILLSSNVFLDGYFEVEDENIL